MGKLQSAWAHFWGTKGKIAGEEKETRRNLGRLEDKLAIDATSLSCAICCCVYAEPPKLLPCGHSLCCVCVPQMKSSEFVNYGSCPFCRTPFRPDRLVKNFALETVLDGVTTEIEDLYKDAVNRGVRPSVTGETDNIAFRSLVEGNLLYDNRRMKKQQEIHSAEMESAKRQIEELQNSLKCWSWGTFALLGLIIYVKLSQSIPF